MAQEGRPVSTFFFFSHILLQQPSRSPPPLISSLMYRRGGCRRAVRTRTLAGDVRRLWQTHPRAGLPRVPSLGGAVRGNNLYHLDLYLFWRVRACATGRSYSINGKAFSTRFQDQRAAMILKPNERPGAQSGGQMCKQAWRFALVYRLSVCCFLSFWVTLFLNRDRFAPYRKDTLSLCFFRTRVTIL